LITIKNFGKAVKGEKVVLGINALPSGGVTDFHD
jgi:hypothetical protein